MSSPAKIYLITGANRASGIGFGLVKEIVSTQSDVVVFATARDPSKATALKELSLKFKNKIEIVKYVAGDVEGNRALSKEIGDKFGHVDTIIANSGIATYAGPAAETSAEIMREHLEINAIAALVLFQAFFSLLKASASPKFIPITSGAGSLTTFIAQPAQYTAYGVSKAALNYIARKIHFENAWLTCFPLAPGMVDTDMARDNLVLDKSGILESMNSLVISPEAAGKMLMDVVDKSTRETHGGEFMNIDGSKIPW